MIVEQAGGKAIDCKLERILEKTPREIHERTTVVMGSKGMVEEMMDFVNKYSAD